MRVSVEVSMTIRIGTIITRETRMRIRGRIRIEIRVSYLGSLEGIAVGFSILALGFGLGIEFGALPLGYVD